MLPALGFAYKCANWIMQCITVTPFRVIGNGKAGYSFHPERGIRQSDPLSTYIFIIYAKYLGLYIQFVSNQKKLFLTLS